MSVTCLDPTDLDSPHLPLWLADVFADLVTIPVSEIGETAFQALVAGNAQVGDNGGGQFVYDPNSALTANGFSVSAAASGIGRWVAVSGVRKLTAPTNATVAGQPGDYAFSTLYRYSCVSNATWRRAPITTF